MVKQNVEDQTAVAVDVLAHGQHGNTAEGNAQGFEVGAGDEGGLVDALILDAEGVEEEFGFLGVGGEDWEFEVSWGEEAVVWEACRSRSG